MVLRWDLISIGNLSRNRFWNERDDCSYRSPLCTTTLICGKNYRLLVDPCHKLGARMAEDLDRRTGLKVDDVDLVFITHEHSDHHAGLQHFPNARWLAAPDVAAAINETGIHVRKVEAVEGKLQKEIEVVPTPGHTLSQHSLRFNCNGINVVVAGDAVMSRDHWQEHAGFPNSADQSLVRASIDKLAGLADIVVPGHDNYFFTAHFPFKG